MTIIAFNIPHLPVRRRMDHFNLRPCHARRHCETVCVVAPEHRKYNHSTTKKATNIGTHFVHDNKYNFFRHPESVLSFPLIAILVAISYVSSTARNAATNISLRVASIEKLQSGRTQLAAINRERADIESTLQATNAMLLHAQDCLLREMKQLKQGEIQREQPNGMICDREEMTAHIKRLEKEVKESERVFERDELLISEVNRNLHEAQTILKRCKMDINNARRRLKRAENSSSKHLYQLQEKTKALTQEVVCKVKQLDEEVTVRYCCFEALKETSTSLEEMHTTLLDMQ